MIATRARQGRRTAPAKQEVKGEFVAQRQVGGEWVKVEAEEYIGEHRRAALLKEYSEWANGAPRGTVRRCVENFTEQGRKRHAIRAESGPKNEPEPWSDVDCALSASRRQAWAS